MPEQTVVERKIEELHKEYAHFDGQVERTEFENALLEIAQWAVESVLPGEDATYRKEWFQCREEIIANAKSLGIPLE